ncbi:MAG: CDP-paratose 2-epimerase [Planctomycetaceae bacterium]|nr:CDP-paratose 2-epimerase [Planctomycetaceae bacterium]
MLTANSRTFALSTKLWAPVNRSHVFELFSDAFQLEHLTPPWLNFRVLTPGPIEMCSGRLIDYQIRLHGLPIRWRTEITEWDPPFCFTDSQLRGPYRSWVHTHTFEELDGGTLVRDRVEYQVPGGSLTNRLFVQGDLRRIFNYRHNQLPGLLAVRVEDCKRGEVLFTSETGSTQMKAEA